MTNGERAKQLIDKYGFDFNNIPKSEVIDLIQKEIADFQPGSSEYIRLLSVMFPMFLYWKKQSIKSVWMWVA